MSDASSKVPLDDEAIETLAAGWLVQEEEGFTPEQRIEFERWQTADPRHRSAVAMMRETCGILEKMPLLPPSAVLQPESESVAATSSEKQKILPFPPQRIWLIATSIAACLVVALGILWLRANRPTFENIYATTGSGYLHVNLPDASVLELNADTEVRVRFVRRERQLALTRGEAHFSVAKNPSQPFVVTAAGVTVRAVGTAFNVRIDQSNLEVLVTEGRVRVNPTQSDNRSPSESSDSRLPELSAGQFLRIETNTRQTRDSANVRTLDEASIRRALAWQVPRLVFNETPLAQVIQQFNERNRVQLELGDHALSTRPVGGTFRADSVETFVQLLEKSGDITVERPSEHRIVLRRSGSTVPP